MPYVKEENLNMEIDKAFYNYFDLSENEIQEIEHER